VSGPVTHRLASEARSSEENTARPSWELLSELIEGDNLTTVGQDASTGTLGDTEGAQLEALRALEHANIVGDGSDNHGHLAVLATHELGELGQGKRRAVHAGHEQTLQDDGVEVGLGAASQEAVKLNSATSETTFAQLQRRVCGCMGIVEQHGSRFDNHRVIHERVRVEG